MWEEKDREFINFTGTTLQLIKLKGILKENFFWYRKCNLFIYFGKGEGAIFRRSHLKQVLFHFKCNMFCLHKVISFQNPQRWLNYISKTWSNQSNLITLFQFHLDITFLLLTLLTFFLLLLIETFILPLLIHLLNFWSLEIFFIRVTLNALF